MRTGRNDTNTLLKKVNTIDMFRPDAMNNLKKENADAFGLTAFKYIYFFFQNTKNYYLQVLLDRKNSEMGGQPIPLHVLSKRTTCQKFWRQKLRSTLRLRKKRLTYLN
jgi:hypothetical protein